MALSTPPTTPTTATTATTTNYSTPTTAATATPTTTTTYTRILEFYGKRPKVERLRTRRTTTTTMTPTTPSTSTTTVNATLTTITALLAPPLLQGPLRDMPSSVTHMTSKSVMLELYSSGAFFHWFFQSVVCVFSNILAWVGSLLKGLLLQCSICARAAPKLRVPHMKLGQPSGRCTCSATQLWKRVSPRYAYHSQGACGKIFQQSAPASLPRNPPFPPPPSLLLHPYI